MSQEESSLARHIQRSQEAQAMFRSINGPAAEFLLTVPGYALGRCRVESEGLVDYLHVVGIPAELILLSHGMGNWINHYAVRVGYYIIDLTTAQFPCYEELGDRPVVFPYTDLARWNYAEVRPVVNKP